MMKPEVEVYEVTEEEWAAIKAKNLADLKAIPEWWDKLADCHVKCSDFDCLTGIFRTGCLLRTHGGRRVSD